MTISSEFCGAGAAAGAPANRARGWKLDCHPMLDFHNHLMPAVDDGAVDIDESRAGLQTLQAHGVTGIITTPHLRASLTLRPRDLAGFLGVLDGAWSSRTSLAAAEFPDLHLERGVELMLDVPNPNLDDARLRLAGTSYVLAEFPSMTVPPHSTLAIRNLRQSGRGKCAVAGCAQLMKDRGGIALHRALTATNPGRLLRDEPPLPATAFECDSKPFWRRMIPWR